MDASTIPQKLLKTVLVLLSIFIAISIINQLRSFSSTPQIMQITGEGKIAAVPDMAMIRIGVTSEGDDPNSVKNENNLKINQVIEYIKQQRIAEKDIQTTDFNLQPKYQYNNGESKITGYQASQTISVKITRIDESRATLEKILGEVTQHGANNIQSLSMSFDSPEKFRDAARKEAIKQAKEKSKALASEAGLRLGAIINVVESTDNRLGPIPFMRTLQVNTASAATIEPNIEPGTQEITQQVTLLVEVYP